MKKIMFLGILVIIIAASHGFAGEIDVTRVTGYFGGNGGGEFTVTPTTTDLKGNLQYYADEALVDPPTTQALGFQTFCLERDEWIMPPSHAYATISDSAQLGGLNTNYGDPLSVGAAWLYYQFATGQLYGYAYAPGSLRAADAGQLQIAIWMFEGEWTASMSNEFYALAVNSLTNEFDSNLSATGRVYDVAVLNIYHYENGIKINDQDQLILVPDGGLTALLLGIGVGGVALISRKFRI